MPVSAIVLTAAQDPGALLAELERDPCLHALTACGKRIGAVLDTPNEVENRAAWARLQAHPSIARVDVVQIFFEPLPGADT